MNVRPFDWRDIPALNRSQRSSVFLDSALLLTRGALMLPGALVSYLAPGMGLFTNVVEMASSPDAPALIGQSIHTPGSPSAHLTFMTPEAALSQPAVAALTESLVTIAGERGALRLLADADEESEAFETLRQSGFAIYTRQRVWQLDKSEKRPAQVSTWRTAASQDAIAIRSLYNNLVPGLVQQIEPLLAKRPAGMVAYQEGEMRGFVELKSGRCGIWAQPFIHPDTENVPQQLEALLVKINNHSTKPVYICVRSYQAWLEPVIEDLGAKAGTRQAVMVKHLTIQQKAQRILALPALDGGQAEISAPIVRMENQPTTDATSVGTSLWNK